MTDDIEIRTDPHTLDVSLIHDYISNRSYWGRGRTLAQVEVTVNSSICFGAYISGQFAGFTRVVSDTIAFAYVLDLFVLEDFRGQGISRRLVEATLAHKKLQTVNWLLGTNDATFLSLLPIELPCPIGFVDGLGAHSTKVCLSNLGHCIRQ